MRMLALLQDDGRKWAYTGLSVLLILSLLLPALFLTLPVPNVRATDGVTKDMTFLLHSVNATETAKPLPGGGSTLTYFDTTLEFNDVNVSVLVEGTQKVLQWFLVPALAGDFNADEFTLRIWANSSTAASSNAQVTVEVYELNETASSLVHTENFGSQSFPVTATLKTWSANFTSHAFLAGSSIELRMIITPGAQQGVWFHYDTPQVNSRLSLSGPDSLDVAGIATLDSERNVATRFDPEAANTTLHIQASIADPLGGYDIRWVNLTLLSPVDLTIIDNASMARVSGTPVSYESTFEISWNYSGQPTGEYTVLVWALDNNGHNHFYFFQQFDYGDYPDVGTTTFFVGGLPVYVNLKVVDSKEVALVGAEVALRSGGFTLDEKVTDSSGAANLTMAKGQYEFQVSWQDVVVASTSQDVQANVTESDPLVVSTQVYYPVFQAEDSEGFPLAGASLIFVHPNGSKLGPHRTNQSGQVTLEQVPVGTYTISAAWRGIDVFAGTGDVVSNEIIAFRTAVYQLMVTGRSGSGVVLAGVFVSVKDSTGLVFDAGLTDEDGSVTLLLPSGDYTVESRYITSYRGSLYDSGILSTQIELRNSTSVEVTFSDFPPSLTSTFVFLLLVVYAITVAALVTALLLLRRRYRGTV